MALNPLLRHPVLQTLPYELLKNPELSKVREFLEKKRRTFHRLKFVLLALFPISAALVYIQQDTHSPFKVFAATEPIFDVFEIIVWPILAITFHLLERRYKLSDNEILTAMNDSKPVQNVPA